MAQLGDMQAGHRELFSVYLNDHLAAAVGGTELAKRTARREQDSELGPQLSELSLEIDRDLRLLRDLARALRGKARAPLKERLAWLGEKVGRLKLNGRIIERSPLSLVLELEILQGAVMSKRALWQTLDELQDEEPLLRRFPIQEMLERANDQHERIRHLHDRAVHLAFGSEASGASP